MQWAGRGVSERETANLVRPRGAATAAERRTAVAPRTAVVVGMAAVGTVDMGGKTTLGPLPAWQVSNSNTLPQQWDA